MLLQSEWVAGDGAVVLAVMKGWLKGQLPSAKQARLLELASARFGIALNDTVEGDVARIESLKPQQQTEVLRLLLVLTCLGDEITDAQLTNLEGLNRRLKQPTTWPTTLKLGRAGKTTRATMSLGKWTPDGKALMRLIWKDEGLLGVFRAVRSTQGKGPSLPKVAAKYEALGSLPEGTLGKAFFTHMRSRKLPMPGEAGGLPERAMHHDLMHVITGFDTTARGEGRLAAVYAGATERHPVTGSDPFTFIMVGLMTFHLGYKVGPPFVGAELGVIEPDEMMQFIQVGQRVPINILTEWKFADDFAVPLVDVRARFGMAANGAQAA